MTEGKLILDRRGIYIGLNKYVRVPYSVKEALDDPTNVYELL